MISTLWAHCIIRQLTCKTECRQYAASNHCCYGAFNVELRSYDVASNKSLLYNCQYICDVLNDYPVDACVICDGSLFFRTQIEISTVKKRGTIWRSDTSYSGQSTSQDVVVEYGLMSHQTHYRLTRFSVSKQTNCIHLADTLCDRQWCD